jgi:hypothetical protein
MGGRVEFGLRRAAVVGSWSLPIGAAVGASAALVTLGAERGAGSLVVLLGHDLVGQNYVLAAIA